MKKTTYTTLFSLLVTTALSPVYAMEQQEDEFSRKTTLTQKSDLENILPDKPLDKTNANPELLQNKPQSLNESSKSESKTSHLSNRLSKRAIGDEFIISQTVNSGKFNPSVATLTNGNVFVTWEGFKPWIDSSLNIYGRVFSPQGTAITDEIPITTTTFNSAYGYLSNENPSVATLTNGNVFITYTGQATPSNNIYGRVFSPNGTYISSAGLMNDPNGFEAGQNYFGAATSPSVVGLANGNAFVTFTAGQINGRVFSPQGAAIGSEFNVNQVTKGSHSSVTGLTNANVFVAWSFQSTGGSGIAGRVLFPNATAISNEFSINQNTTGTHYNPFVANLSNGNVFITWYSNQNGNYDIYGRVFSSQGTAISNEIGINQVTTGDQEHPSVASVTNGNVLVAWDGNQNGKHNIYGRVFSPQGTAISNEFQINQVTTGDQINPSVASLANGDAFVAWSDGGSVSSSNDISGRIVPGQGLTPPPVTPPVSVPVTAPASVPVTTPVASPLTSSSNRLTPNSLFLIPGKIVMSGVNYVKSYFSSKSWSEYFDSTEKTVLAYAKSVVDETPSYRSWHGNASLGKSTQTYAPLNVSYTTGAGFLPHFVISGAIGQ